MSRAFYDGGREEKSHSSEQKIAVPSSPAVIYVLAEIFRLRLGEAPRRPVIENGKREFENETKDDLNDLE